MTDQIYSANRGWIDGLDTAGVAYHLQRAQYAKINIEQRDRLTDRDYNSIRKLNVTIKWLQERAIVLERVLRKQADTPPEFHQTKRPPR